MKFQFDWKESVAGSVEIEADSGRHAEEIFRSMSRADLLEKSFKIRSAGIGIDFIDNRLTGMVTHQEWKNDWSLSDEECEFWSNATADSP